ncbi:WD40 repeat-like protein [Pleurotus eryngii]|uniref:WD40 repeat-like protein n=1 Tax=Pleurotus eryngii TaxID=5323 RepID=A0A9P5ZR65_PLEER|nr:WD40 repeat-like protein [Pleurotus eryngii]
MCFQQGFLKSARTDRRGLRQEGKSFGACTDIQITSLRQVKFPSLSSSPTCFLPLSPVPTVSSFSMSATSNVRAEVLYVSPSTVQTPHRGRWRCVHNLSDGGRNLVLCIENGNSDGIRTRYNTQASDNSLMSMSVFYCFLQNSNVLELYSRLEDIKNSQVVMRHQLGRTASFKHKAFGSLRLRLRGKVRFDRGFKLSVIAAYRMLAQTYEYGDKIYLFGFAEGAYQAGFIADMIGQVGLLRDGSSDQTETAYKLYIHSIQGNQLLACQKFKAAFSHRDVKVHFVGLWDTVFPEVGLLQQRPRMDHVCAFRHALALDEPLSPDARDDGSDWARAGDVKEVWFRGSREHVGGVDSSESRIEFTAAFCWMVYEAAKYGLILQLPRPGPPPPIPHNQDREISSHTSSRVTKPYQLVHESVFDAIDCSLYIPLARPHIREAWKDPLFRSAVTEYDHRLAGNKDTTKLNAQELENLVSTDLGLRLFLERLDALDMIFHVLSGESRGDFPALAQALKSLPALPAESRTRSYSEIRKIANELDPGLSESGQNVLCRNLGQSPFFAQGHVATFVAYSGDSTCIASVYMGGKIRIWDANTGDKDKYRHLLEPESEGESSVNFNSIAFDLDGRSIVSGSSKGGLWRWDLETGKPTKIGQRGKAIHSVACLPGGRIVSGSDDGTINIWGRDGIETTLGLHTAIVSSLASSSDGSIIVSGSHDKEARVWKRIGEEDSFSYSSSRPVVHEAAVNCVACTKDGAHIVSGSEDMTCQIWDSDTEEPTPLPRSGPAAGVVAVAYTPSGEYLVAASGCDIFVWDAATRPYRPLGRPIQGHTAVIHSLALSPDGDCIASASADGTVRVWDRSTGEQKLGPIEQYDRVWDKRAGKQRLGPIEQYAGDGLS